MSMTDRRRRDSHAARLDGSVALQPRETGDGLEIDDVGADEDGAGEGMTPLQSN